MAQTLTQDDLDAIVAAIRDSFAATALDLAGLNIVSSLSPAVLIECDAGDAIQISATGGSGITIAAEGTGMQIDAIAGLTITASGGGAINLTSSTTHGFYSAGGGSGSGIYAIGSANGNGMYLQGGSTSGSGLYAKAVGNSDQDSGIYATCFGTLGSGLYVEAKHGGHGIWAESEGSGDAFHMDVGGAGVGLRADSLTVTGVTTLTGDITAPAQTAGRPTKILGMLRRVFEWTANKKTRNRTTGDKIVYGVDGTTVLETQTQSTSGVTDQETKGA